MPGHLSTLNREAAVTVDDAGKVGWGQGREKGNVLGRKAHPSKLSALFFWNKNTPVMKSTVLKDT